MTGVSRYLKAAAFRPGPCGPVPAGASSRTQDVQTTIRTVVDFRGIGLHSGRPVRMSVAPAPAGSGIRFLRSDVAADGSGRDPLVPALWDAVTPSRLCTVVENADGVSVSTIEHIMAALSGCGIHNALVRIDAPEVPILDGSAAPFVKGLLRAGLRQQAADLICVEVLKPVEVRDGAAVARLEPAPGLEIDFSIDFDDAAIGHQEKHLRLANGTFVRELSDSRTFCRQSDVDAMRANGLALGGTYENAVVVDGDRILSPGGLRHPDEAVRHKMLDAMGDLALAGAPILGRYTGTRAGHAMTNRLLRALFADADAFRMTAVPEPRRRNLPGAGVDLSDIPAVA